MDFKQWISRYADENSPRGDLAYDISRDANFPDTNDPDRIETHILACGGCAEALKTFRTCWRAYRRSMLRG